MGYIKNLPMLVLLILLMPFFLKGLLYILKVYWIGMLSLLIKLVYPQIDYHLYGEQPENYEWRLLDEMISGELKKIRCEFDTHYISSKHAREVKKAFVKRFLK